MSLNMNKNQITGNLVATPELQTTKTGRVYISSTIGHTESWKKGEVWHSRTSFIDFELWGDAAKRAAAELRKGSFVLVEGKTVQDRWEDEGQKRSRVKISAQSVKLISHAKPKTEEAAPAATKSEVLIGQNGQPLTV